MIVRLIAETEAEQKRFGGNDGVEHTGVKEYFMAGNRVDDDGMLVDFHEWNGAWKYLLGMLNYFYEVIYADMRKSLRGAEESPPDHKAAKNNVIPMVKKGMGGPIQNLDISNLNIHHAQDATIEDDFVEEDGPTLDIHQIEDVEDVAEGVAEQIKKQAKGKGLRIVP